MFLKVAVSWARPLRRGGGADAASLDVPTFTSLDAVSARDPVQTSCSPRRRGL